MDDYARFIKKYTINPTTNCWEWTGYIDNRGYARFLFNKKNELAHKYIYEKKNGPAKEYIIHTCGVKHCVNPDHLKEGKNKGRNITIPASEILRLHQSGLSTKEIASQLDCDVSLVRLRLREMSLTPEPQNKLEIPH